jgi:uncharacterized membrane protein
MRKNFEFKTSNAVIGLLIFVGVFAGMYFIAINIFRLLAWISPVLFVAALILDYKTVLNYGKWVIGLYKNNLAYGIIVTLLSIVGYPLVFTYLFFKSLMSYRYKQVVKEKEKQQPGEYIEFEEVEEKNFELPPIKEKEKQNKGNEYDQLF